MATSGTEQASEIKGGKFLFPEQKSGRAVAFFSKLKERIVGQDAAVQGMSDLYQVHLAGMNAQHRPIGTMLFLGPTGSGKTRVVEASAEVLFGDAYKVVKIDCAEFQHSHEIAKLIGSPPGYLGHRETSPLLTQENLNRSHTDEQKLTIVLFDEIEKASDSLWQLLLGILDKATLTLGDNRRVDFSQTIVVMTSNLGAREMSDMITGGIGFTSGQEYVKRSNDEQLDQQIQRTAVEAARRKFSPEFMNRIDKIVVFRSLQENHLRQILDLELQAVQERVMATASTKFIFECSAEAKERLLSEGQDTRYGARHLKRSVERLLVSPLSNLVASEQVEFGDLIYVDLDGEEFTFEKRSVGPLINDLERKTEQTNTLELDYTKLGLPVECDEIWFAV
jgi:ATP-dependent Clp protease ATP-binding subunit ClpA